MPFVSFPSLSPGNQCGFLQGNDSKKRKEAFCLSLALHTGIYWVFFFFLCLSSDHHRMDVLHLTDQQKGRKGGLREKTRCHRLCACRLQSVLCTIVCLAHSSRRMCPDNCINCTVFRTKYGGQSIVKGTRKSDSLCICEFFQCRIPIPHTLSYLPLPLQLANLFSFSVSCTAQYETRKPARSCTRYLHLQQRERIGQKKRKNGSNIELNDESLFSFSDLFRVALLFAFNNSKRGNRYMDGVLTWLLHSMQHRRFEIMHPSDRTVLIQELHSFHSNSIHT